MSPTASRPALFRTIPARCSVEEVIAAHPTVAEVCVAGVLDPYQGEAVKAWVGLKPGEQLSAKRITDYCRSILYPKHVRWLQK